MLVTDLGSSGEEEKVPVRADFNSIPSLRGTVPPIIEGLSVKAGKKLVDFRHAGPLKCLQ